MYDIIQGGNINPKMYHNGPGSKDTPKVIGFKVNTFSIDV